MRVGILTGGGDCPGLNAVIRAAAKTLFSGGVEVLGFRDGYRGIIEKDWMPIDKRAISGLLHRGEQFWERTTATTHLTFR